MSRTGKGRKPGKKRKPRNQTGKGCKTGKGRKGGRQTGKGSRKPPKRIFQKGGISPPLFVTYMHMLQRGLKQGLKAGNRLDKELHRITKH